MFVCASFHLTNELTEQHLLRLLSENAAKYATLQAVSLLRRFLLFASTVAIAVAVDGSQGLDVSLWIADRELRRVGLPMLAAGVFDARKLWSFIAQ